MKLFGKKDKAETPADNEAVPPGLSGDTDMPDAFGADAGIEEFEGGDAQPLSAPSRKFSAGAGGGRRGLLMAVAILAVAGLGAGYYFFLGGVPDYTAPVHVTGNIAGTEAASPAVPGTPEAASPAGTPPQPAPADTAAAAPPAATTAPGIPAPANPAAAALGTPPAEEANATPLSSAPEPAPVPGTPLVNPAQPGTPGSVNATLSTPPGAAPAPVTANTMQPAPGEMTPDMPPSGMIAPGAAPLASSAAPIPAAPVAPAPASDLPMPGGTMMQPAPAAASTPPQPVPPQPAPAPSVTTSPASPAENGKPNDAELAIVQNSAVLDQLSQPVKPGTGTLADNKPKPTVADSLKSVEQLLETPAIIRPLPGGYVTVRKESEASDLDSRVIVARTALNRGKSAAALQMFDDLHRDYPKDQRVLMGRAVALQKVGQGDDALAAYEEVLNRDPKNLQALTNMLGLLKAKDPALATEKLLELHKAYPYQSDIAAQLGIAYGSAGNYPEAQKYLEMADSLKPGSAYVMYNRAVLYDKMGNVPQASDLYRQILTLSMNGELDQPLPVEMIRNRLSSMK